MLFTNKVALVTGGTSGIGRTAAITLAQNGAKVLVAGRRENEGEETIILIKDAGGEAIFHKTDVSNSSDVQAMVEKVVNTYGRLDIAFNNAGILGQPGLLADQSEDSYNHIFDINLKGLFLSMKYEIQQMLKQNSGVIVNTSSINGFRSVAPGLALYNTSKQAVVTMTKSVALEYAQSGIRINAIAPGGIETDMLKMASGGHTEAFAQAIPMKKLGTPSDIASAVIWLCSDAASYITGHTLVVDGGFLAQ